MCEVFAQSIHCCSIVLIQQ